MRKFLIPIVAGISVIAMTAPASAQYARPVDRYHRYDRVAFDGRGLQVRVDRIRAQIRNLEARRILSYREGRSLERQAANLQGRVYRASRNGIHPGEARRLTDDIQRLEYRVRREASDLNNRPNRRY